MQNDNLGFASIIIITFCLRGHNLTPYNCSKNRPV